MIEIKKVNNSEDLDHNYRIRHAVFVNELGMIKSDEHDRYDKEISAGIM